MIDRRVLGVLVEKAKTTPDAYPMSLNSLVTGCNQKSNREPLLNLSEDDVEDALARAQKAGLVVRVTSSSSRVERWRHILYEAWHVDKIELPILAELLLRGPQTEGELRGRVSRMEPIDDLEVLRNHLRLLVDRNLVVRLTAEAARGAIVTHGFHDPQELERLRAQFRGPAPVMVAPSPIAPPPSPAPPVAPPPTANIEQLSRMEAALIEARAEIDGLKRLMSELQTKLGTVAEELRQLKQSLGAS
jgi:uncharacterized protein YceH (UPF0502 family)